MSYLCFVTGVLTAHPIFVLTQTCVTRLEVWKIPVPYQFAIVCNHRRPSMISRFLVGAHAGRAEALASPPALGCMRLAMTGEGVLLERL